MKTKQISIGEYVKKIDSGKFRQNREHPDGMITHSAVKYRIKNGMNLPDVIKYTKVGRIHILTVNSDF
jgi:hypothetical protein